MIIEYYNGQIVDVHIKHTIAQQRMTHTERMTILGCATPDPLILEALSELEGGGPLSDFVDVLVAQNAITSQRGAEIKGS